MAAYSDGVFVGTHRVDKNRSVLAERFGKTAENTNQKKSDFRGFVVAVLNNLRRFFHWLLPCLVPMQAQEEIKLLRERLVVLECFDGPPSRLSITRSASVNALLDMPREKIARLEDVRARLTEQVEQLSGQIKNLQTTENRLHNSLDKLNDRITDLVENEEKLNKLVFNSRRDQEVAECRMKNMSGALLSMANNFVDKEYELKRCQQEKNQLEKALSDSKPEEQITKQKPVL